MILQVETINITNLLIGAIATVCGAIVALFFIYKKTVKDHAASLKESSEKIQKVYETVVKETNAMSQKNTQAVEMNTMVTKNLSEFIKELPGDIKRALRD